MRHQVSGSTLRRTSPARGEFDVRRAAERALVAEMVKMPQKAFGLQTGTSRSSVRSGPFQETLKRLLRLAAARAGLTSERVSPAAVGHCLEHRGDPIVV